MSATERIAAKASRQMADIIVDTLAEVDEVIIGTPRELAREHGVIAVIKVHLRVGEDIRDHLPLPVSIAYRVIDHLVRGTVPDEEVERRRADEEIESALINLFEGMDTRRWAQQRPLRISGTYTKANATTAHVVMTWYSDNTVRLTK